MAALALRLFLFWSLVTCSSAFGPFGPLSADFQTYLSSMNMDHLDFTRADLGGNGSFGGRQHPGQAVRRTPVIFIHGNSDSALWTNEFSTGWESSLKAFLKKGYRMGELYGTSWGNTVTGEAIYRYHSCEDVRRLRAFIKAVMNYTGSSRVSVIAHSMGTTLMRKAIQGGRIEEPSGDSCYLGPSLAPRIEVFVGISSANAGLCWCAGAGANYPACNDKNGFFVSTECRGEPATSCSTVTCSAQRSNLLLGLTAKDAERVYSIWSSADELIGGGGMVWGVQTCLVPHSDGAEIYSDLSHMKTKELSADVQWQMVSKVYI